MSSRAPVLRRRSAIAGMGAGLAVAGFARPRRASAQPAALALDALVRAYPAQLAGREGDVLVWHDGTRMSAVDGWPNKPIEAAVEDGSVLDQLRLAYRAGPVEAPPGPGDDAGRIRNRAFFDKMYGDCDDPAMAGRLVSVPWMPDDWGGDVRVTPVNGVADRLAAVSRELSTLPLAERRLLFPSAGAFACRCVAHSRAPSMHRWGAAIDINVAASDYWEWHRWRGGVIGPARVTLPDVIVTTFERHGFIWGGKWSHFDTMHFEYRPEFFV